MNKIKEKNNMNKMNQIKQEIHCSWHNKMNKVRLVIMRQITGFAWCKRFITLRFSYFCVRFTVEISYIIMAIEGNMDNDNQRFRDSYHMS